MPATIKKGLKMLARVLDVILVPFIFLILVSTKLIRKYGFTKLPCTRRILEAVGVYPIISHYYDPLVKICDLTRHLQQERKVLGFDLNIAEQINIIKQFNCKQELTDISWTPTADGGFFYNNGAFECGDADYCYSFIRHFKPKTIIEIGSGHSTLISRKAADKNRAESSAYSMRHICIEPYENQWLEKTGAEIIRAPVESLDVKFFQQLEAGDLLFIDSTHIIRPAGDVLFEYLQLLPSLNPGVYVHIHDIFTPSDYPKEVIIEQRRFWNEQYLLEAFLSCNDKFKVIASLNHLHNKYRDCLVEAFPNLLQRPDAKPGSFWMQKTK